MQNYEVVLSGRTLTLLKNFSQINPSIVFETGDKLATVSLSKTVLAKATIAERFETTFAIYDLQKFLSVLSLFDHPKLVIKDSSMLIVSGSKRVSYTFADLSLFKTPDKIDPYSKNLVLPSVDVNFTLTQDVMQDLKKALSVLRLPEIAVIGDGETIAIEAIDSKNPTGNIYAIDVGTTADQFRYIFKEENLRLTPGDYNVEISSKRLARFTGVDVEYFVAIEAN